MIIGSDGNAAASRLSDPDRTGPVVRHAGYGPRLREAGPPGPGPGARAQFRLSQRRSMSDTVYNCAALSSIIPRTPVLLRRPPSQRCS
eukprot:307199-Hanusia_phi.AAC.1